MEKRLIKMIKQLIGRVFYVGEDKASEQETIDRIKDSVDFRGAKLWILIFAIFVAEKVLNAAESVQKECRVLFPEVNSLHIGYGINIHLEKEAPSDTTTLISIRLKQKMNKATEKKLKEWLKQKIQADSLVIYPL